MDDQKKQVVEKLKAANNILVTVSSSPSVDQLSAAIGLTLMLNKLGKHATAVFSGEVPSTIEFLKPEETLEKNTDSLRDFIISLDKSKADKLRYKVEENVVRIFITPYRTSIDEHDLEFGQGDFNVDVVVALGVREQQDLDTAITAHGRILHDATVVSIRNFAEGELGTLKWQDMRASSLSELITRLIPDLGKDVLDNQVATALLTGIVAETHRFSNDKTTPDTMSASASLMSAGANQQLVATQLEASGQPADVQLDQSATIEAAPAPKDTLQVGHTTGEMDDLNLEDLALPQPAADAPQAPEAPAPETTEHERLPEEPSHESEGFRSSTKRIIQPPSEVTENSENTPVLEDLDLSTLEAPAGAPASDMPVLSHDEPKLDEPAATSPSDDNKPVEPEASAPAGEPAGNETLEDIERSVNSTHVSGVDDARKAVESALNSGPSTDVTEPIEALGAQHIDLETAEPVAPEAAAPATSPEATPAPSAYSQAAPFNPTAFLSGQPQTPAENVVNPTFPPAPSAPAANEPAPLEMSPADQPFTMPLPPTMNMPSPQVTPPTNTNTDPSGPPPPPVPPPMMPPGFTGPNSQT